MNNIAEGFGRFSNKEFIRFLDISKASCIELESMSYILEDLNVISPDQLIEFRNQISVTQAKTNGLLKYLAEKQKRLK